jgi:UDP-N-acetylmuramoyl-tripeptide--D-alanyl-D-alanine ligase
MPVLRAKEVAEWTGGRWTHEPDGFNGVSTDSRALQKGCLYVALKGERFDGHSFVAAAFEQGASAAVVDASFDARMLSGRPLLRVADTHRALKDLARAYRCKVAPLVIGVTGSAGKSTVKEMTAQVLAARHAVAATCGNWNNDIGLPLSLLQMDAHTRFGVFEAGSNHPGEIKSLCAILQPDWGIVTNVGPVHIEFFGSMDAIAREKAELLKCLPAGGVAVINKDSAGYEILRASASCRVVTVSAKSGADYVCREWHAEARRAIVEEAMSGDRVDVELPLPGIYNMINAMEAMAVARAAGMEWQVIAGALRQFKSLPMRWEDQDICGVKVINDAYNSNPLSMKAAIQAFADMEMGGGKWLVLADMRELGESAEREHRAVGAWLASGVWRGLVVYGALANWIADSAVENGFASDHIFRSPTHAAAAGYLHAHVAPGDAVFLKGSHSMSLEKVVAAWKSLGAGQE